MILLRYYIVVVTCTRIYNIIIMFLFVRVRASAKSFRKQCGVPLPPLQCTLPRRPDDIQRSNYTRITIIIYDYYSTAISL